MRTYFDTNVVSYLVRARTKEDYKEKIEMIEQLIQEGLIEPVTSVITEDEAEELKKADIRSYLANFEIVQSSIAVFPYKLDRDRFGDDYTHGLYDEYFEGEAKPNKALDREDALHYVNILDRKNKIELAISGDKRLLNKLKAKHSELPTLYFHDENFSNELLKAIEEKRRLACMQLLVSVSSSLVVFSASVAVSASSASVAATVSSAKPSFLLILFTAQVVLSVHFFYWRFCDCFEAAVSAYV